MRFEASTPARLAEIRSLMEGRMSEIIHEVSAA